MQLKNVPGILDANEHELGALADRDVLGFSIDSRSVRAGELFFAIKGPNHDGHRFVADVLEKGALAAVVDRGFGESESMSAIDSRRVIRVDDTLIALQRLASGVLKNWRGKVVGITGSMGKTTTKEMTAATLSSAGRVNKTVGNLNNEFGLPLSILRMETDGSKVADFDFAVLEMGMNHKGEIAHLCEIAPPDISVVTVVAPVHLEFFKSVDEIGEAKSEIVTGTRPGGAAVLNADDQRVSRMRELRKDLTFRTFGLQKDADVVAGDIETDGLSSTTFTLATPRGKAKCKLPLAGLHNIYNALAAASVADYIGVAPEDIASALSLAVSPKMRGEVVQFADGFRVIDDSYNSNPRALVEMVRTLVSDRTAKRRVVVAGEMLELGQSGAQLHREAGREIQKLGADLLIGVRGLAKEIVEGAHDAGMPVEAAIFCESPGEAASLMAKEAREGDLILVKGSRGVKTEIVVQELKQTFEQLGVRDEPAGH